ncbi:hypothetical protein BDP27DRAFT_1420858 [Rhodocollybia butyracea]|uniref:Uncharacterized protein n=1 Tax=Rhodocollybia butyracea TaxID=206335 RepID=A0A9P5U874_9AGAR|nr:hypothetical protein BDP27DRAFT_1420858 [Rhodocollybia butyracea]
MSMATITRTETEDYIEEPTLPATPAPFTLYHPRTLIDTHRTDNGNTNAESVSMTINNGDVEENIPQTLGREPSNRGQGTPPRTPSPRNDRNPMSSITNRPIDYLQRDHRRNLRSDSSGSEERNKEESLHSELRRAEGGTPRFHRNGNERPLGLYNMGSEFGNPSSPRNGRRTPEATCM